MDKAKTESGKGLNGYDMAPIRHLVAGALAELYAGNLDTERAMWRLVDAAGMLSLHFPDAVGVSESTGRGYRIFAIHAETPRYCYTCQQWLTDQAEVQRHPAGHSIH